MVKKIWFDPGHGKQKDSGAVNAKQGLVEAELVLIIANFAADYLNDNYTGFTIGWTRKDQTFVSLTDRCKKANSYGADVFISFHINAGGGTGYESFIYNKTESDETKRLQKIINEKAMAAAGKFGLKAHGNDPFKKDNLAVLRGSTMPAVLTEACYIDSDDYKLLKNGDFLKAMGEAYAEGVATFLSLPKKAASKPTNAPSASKPANKMIRVIYDGKEGLAVRENPNFDEKPIGHVKKGDAFTVVQELDNFYKLKSGLYITKHPKYVQVI